LGEHRYNRYGYRGSDWSVEPGDAERRVAVLGDSRVFGLFVDTEQTLAARISEAEGFEGLNFGVTGAGTFEALDYIVDDVLQTSPGAAVLLYDINPSVLALAPASSWSLRGTWSQLLRGSALVRRLEMLLLHWRRGTEGRVPSVVFQDYKEQYREVIDRLRSGGVTQIVMLVGVTALDDHPGLFFRERYDQYREGARDVAQSRGLKVIELESVLSDLSVEEAYRGVGIHWSPDALIRIAGTVVSELRVDAAPSEVGVTGEESLPPSGRGNLPVLPEHISGQSPR
jgi:hypothetical protein